jgi:GPH family glycoside/pentoside/hexuronide:cation symporter
MICIPLWVWLSKKVDKKISYIAGMTLTLAAVMAFSFFADKIGSINALILMALAGVGFASHYVLPWAMAPDAIEYGFSVSGVRREGVYYSVWTFVIALGGALAGFLVGHGLGLFGYVPDVVQTAESARGIRLIIGILPAVFILLGSIVLAFYPLNKKRYAEVLQKIKEMTPGK